MPRKNKRTPLIPEPNAFQIIGLTIDSESNAPDNARMLVFLGIENILYASILHKRSLKRFVNVIYGDFSRRISLPG